MNKTIFVLFSVFFLVSCNIAFSGEKEDLIQELIESNYALQEAVLAANAEGNSLLSEDDVREFIRQHTQESPHLTDAEVEYIAGMLRKELQRKAKKKSGLTAPIEYWIFPEK